MSTLSSKSPPDSLIQLLWAKSVPFHPLLFHCIDVGNVARSLLVETNSCAHLRALRNAWGGIEDTTACQWAGYLTALHDIGKCDPDFQGKSETLAAPLRDEGLPFRKTPTVGFRHECRSWEWLPDHLMTQWGWGHKAALTVGRAVRGHHGNFAAKSLPEPPVQHQAWQPLRDALASELSKLFMPSAWSPQDLRNHAVAGMVLSGLIVMSDWIASNPELFDWVGINKSSYREGSKHCAEQAIKRLGLNATIQFPAPTGFRDIWMGPEFKDMRPLQCAVENIAKIDLDPGLAIIEAPTGEGKTEAAVYLATQWQGRSNGNGFYIAMPTAATSNQMHARISAFLARFQGGQDIQQVHLVHGMAWVIDEHTPAADSVIERDQADASTWFRPTRRALLAPIAVGTVD